MYITFLIWVGEGGSILLPQGGGGILNTASSVASSQAVWMGRKMLFGNQRRPDITGMASGSRYDHVQVQGGAETDKREPMRIIRKYNNIPAMTTTRMGSAYYIVHATAAARNKADTILHYSEYYCNEHASAYLNTFTYIRYNNANSRAFSSHHRCHYVLARRRTMTKIRSGNNCTGSANRRVHQHNVIVIQ